MERYRLKQRATAYADQNATGYAARGEQKAFKSLHKLEPLKIAARTLSIPRSGAQSQKGWREIYAPAGDTSIFPARCDAPPHSSGERVVHGIYRGCCDFCRLAEGVSTFGWAANRRTSLFGDRRNLASESTPAIGARMIPEGEIAVDTL